MPCVSRLCLVVDVYVCGMPCALCHVCALRWMCTSRVWHALCIVSCVCIVSRVCIVVDVYVTCVACLVHCVMCVHCVTCVHCGGCVRHVCGMPCALCGLHQQQQRDSVSNGYGWRIVEQFPRCPHCSFWSCSTKEAVPLSQFMSPSCWILCLRCQLCFANWPCVCK